MIEKRFNIQEQFRAKFYQLPKVLFTNEKYMKLRVLLQSKKI